LLYVHVNIINIITLKVKCFLAPTEAAEKRLTPSGIQTMVRGDRETTSGWEIIWRQDHLRWGIFEALDTKDAKTTVEVPAHRRK
jgi:hypothetical protein